MNLSTWIIANAVGFIAILWLIYIAFRQHKIAKQIVEIRGMVNGRVDQLLLQAAISGRFEGAEIERLAAAIEAAKRVP